MRGARARFVVTFVDRSGRGGPVPQHNLPSMTYFPYMVFARTRAQLASHCLTQSGMPTPPASELELSSPTRAIDAGYAGVQALPDFEARIAGMLGVDPRRVIATLGASGGMHLAAWRFFRPGSRVASETPSYEP